jgi:hypothetical protein
MNDDVPLPPPSEDELPPPPSDIAAQSKDFGEVKIRKVKPLASVRRAFTIFQKDLSTMAKHGLVSSVILFIFLALIFYIMSFTMEQAVKFDFGGGDGDGEGNHGIPPGTGVDIPHAQLSVTPGISIPAGTSLTFDGSSSTDNHPIAFYVWSVSDGYDDTDQFGSTIHHTFYLVGDYQVRLTVVDDEWNMNETMRTIHVTQANSDNMMPMANAGSGQEVNVGTTVTLDATNSTDDIGIVDYTWMFDDGIQIVLHGSNVTYLFNNAGNFNINLIVRDSSGNAGYGGTNVNVRPSFGDPQNLNVNANVPSSVGIGEEVQLDASGSNDIQGTYTWYIVHNGTLTTLTGQVTSFTADELGPYEITLIVRDSAGNTGNWESMVIALPAGMELEKISWTATPFGQDISFNVLTYAYGIALLASVIFVGGLFAKGFTHEITKGTAKILFFGPISVTTMVFSKILYPLLIGPIFIFPAVFVGLSIFDRPITEVLMITFVSYAFTAVTMVSAAYGSNLIYLATKKMSIKPSVLSRMFLYLSLIGTLTVFEWMSFLMDTWQKTDSWGSMYDKFGGIAALSPFHQGGVILSNMLTGTSWSIDLWVFAIPAILIIGGIFASRKLYGDIFARE